MRPSIEELFHEVQRDYTSLWDYSLRGDTLEIVTPHSTVTGRFVSVYVTQRENAFIVTDGGDLHTSAYLPFDGDGIGTVSAHSRCLDTLRETLATHYRIKEVEDQRGITICYKKTDEYDLVTSLIHDVAAFIAGTVNGIAAFADVTELEVQHRFTQKANQFLAVQFRPLGRRAVRFNARPEGIAKPITFNAVVQTPGNGTSPATVHLISYLSGAKPPAFYSSIFRAAMNYRAVEKRRLAIGAEYQVALNRVAIIDSECEGYQQGQPAEYLEQLGEVSDIGPVKWDSREGLTKQLWLGAPSLLLGDARPGMR